MNIPFSPPFVDQDVIDEVVNTLETGWITTGPKVKALEIETAKLVEVNNVLCVNSATSALMLILHWYGIGSGDEVIVPAYTYSATALAVMHVGAIPIMVDIENDFNISVQKIKAAITSRTKAIMPVDIAGWPCNYNEINSLVNDSEIKKLFTPKGVNQENLGRILVLSDAAHSIGAKYYGKQSGTLTDISVFSYHAVKNVTTAEGGAICLNLPEPFDNAEVYKTLRLWSLNGQTKDAYTKTQAGGWRYDIVYPGFKINMPDVCAAIGLAQIKKYTQQLLVERRRVFEAYNKLFSEKDWAILPPFETEYIKSSYHLYALRINSITESERDGMMYEIAKTGVSVNVHFIPMPMLSVFKNMGYDIKEYPNSYANYSREISLPIYPQLTQEQIEFIVLSTEQAFKQIKIF
ncbi:MAG: DegT/DnrJ/EryC1/StrS family aminotransferase [Bacteroidota bacterium]|nr:DegT/DnrJ/EryC1/StrS family aminotransferase [Bacteroidota bacterium]